MTDFVEVKTSELTGGSLNWAVAKAEGYEPMLFPHSRNEYGVVASLGSVEEGTLHLSLAFTAPIGARAGR
jgi:hypothetical protein